MKQLIPIIDLHCDLLCYLERDPSRTPFDAQVRCSIPQLQQGNVKLQVMAAFADTGKSSSIVGKRQIKICEFLSANSQGDMGQLKTLFSMISDDTVLRELQDLVKKNIIKKRGKTKGSYYELVT